VDGDAERYKIQLVIDGYSQVKGIYYDDTFSLVAKLYFIGSLLV
jgi:hypothetical protein